MKSLLIAFLFLNQVQAMELVSLKVYLKNELSSSKKMSKEVFKLEENQKKAMKELAPNSDDESFTFYYGKSEGGDIEKACTVVPQQGKEGPLSVGVCYNNSGLVNSVTVLSSEEVRGKKVAEASFLDQFKGKKVSDAYQVGKDVNGISGATWSSNSVSEAIRKSGFAYKTFVGGKK
jgi:Na+-translocating ferredoxin:NAD+ oxidoreductase RnfG subunit